jgi:hypothetical protein
MAAVTAEEHAHEQKLDLLAEVAVLGSACGPSKNC